MKKTFLLLLVLVELMACNKVEDSSLKVELLSPYWDFTPSQSIIGELSPINTEENLMLPNDIENGFTIRFSANLHPVDSIQLLLEIPQVLTVNLRKHNPENEEKQNYSAYKMPDGSVPVLEASLSLQSPYETEKFQEMTIGLPLAMLEIPFGIHDITLHFSGIQWTIYVDGRLFDNDFALGYPSGARMKTWNIDSQYVTDAKIFIPALHPQRISAPEPQISSNIQFWTPPYHNAWVGDVATFFYKNRYHIFYLFDRRGHASKFGKGGHYFEHLSTIDFKTWTEHEPATPIEQQWETFGTGTPFVHNDKLCLSYGLHTTRIYPKEKTTLPMQWSYLEKNRHSGSFNYDTIPDLIPAGSTYSISEDGISNFKKTHILIHPCENPSIYTDPDGNLKMLANYGSKGTWTAESVTGGWKCVNPDFPLGGDCTFFFRWGGYDYIIGGFNRLWYKPATADDSAYQDMVASGIDFYNGMSVPSITKIKDDRYLMAGWVKTQNWGGPLVIHELIQHSDGQIGNKWMEEIVPATEEATKLAQKLTQTGSFQIPKKSFLLSFEVHPDRSEEGIFGIVFSSKENNESACEWQMQLDKKRAQFAQAVPTRFAENQKSLREGGNTSTAYNYAIENGIDTNKPFEVRIIVLGSDKLNGSMIDVEIAKQRTMLSYRPKLFVNNLQFKTDGVIIKNIQISQLRD